MVVKEVTLVVDNYTVVTNVEIEEHTEFSAIAPIVYFASLPAFGIVAHSYINAEDAIVEATKLFNYRLGLNKLLPAYFIDLSTKNGAIWIKKGQK